MLYLLKKQNLSLSRFLELTAWNPAAFMGLESKGRIQVGYDADLMVVDFREERRIKGEELHSKCGWTPFEGYTAIFPMDVYLRGERVIHNWEIDVERNGVPLWR